ncbi:hypothetical protein LguiB_003439 [Lonicera macranthoides]
MDVIHMSVYFKRYDMQCDMSRFLQEVLDLIKKNKVCFKGGLMTPIRGRVSWLNVQLRKELDLFASLMNCFNLPGLTHEFEHKEWAGYLVGWAEGKSNQQQFKYNIDEESNQQQFKAKEKELLEYIFSKSVKQE